MQTTNLFSTITLMLLLPAVLPRQAPGPGNMPVIDMHFHTMWLEPNTMNRRTGSAPTPEEMRQRNLAALDRNHIVKAVASGDQLDRYAGERGGRLLPGIILPGISHTMAVEPLNVTP